MTTECLYLLFFIILVTKSFLIKSNENISVSCSESKSSIKLDMFNFDFPNGYNFYQETSNLNFLSCSKMNHFKEIIQQIDSGIQVIDLDFGILSNFTAELSPKNLQNFDWASDLILLIKNIKKFEIKSELNSDSSVILLNKIIFSNVNFEFSLDYFDPSKQFFPSQLYIDSVYFLGSNTYSKPFSFYNLNDLSINNLFVYNLTLENSLQFINDSQDQSQNIANLLIFNSQLVLNKKLLNKYLFTNLKTISIVNSSLFDIENDLLSNFDDLVLVNISLNNFQQLIKRSGENLFKSLIKKDIITRTAY